MVSLQDRPFSKRAVFYPHIINLLVFWTLRLNRETVFQSNVLLEEVFGMLPASANGGTFVDLKKGAPQKGYGADILRLVPSSRAELSSHLQAPR